MKVTLSQTVLEALAEAPAPVQKAFIKQLTFLIRNLTHPSLHAKKYDAASDLWQARINDDWRFYFKIVGDEYRIFKLIPHPK